MAVDGSFQKFIKHTRRILHTIGCWPISYYELGKPRRYLYRIFGTFIYISVIFISFGIAYYNFANTSWSSLFDSLVEALGSIISVYNISLVIWKRFELYKLIKHADVVSSLVVLNQNVPEIQKLELESSREASRATLLMLASITGVFASYTTAFLIGKIRYNVPYSFPYPIEFPFQWRQPAVYAVLLVLETIASVTYISGHCGIPSLFATVVLFAKNQFELLKLSIIKIMDIGHTKLIISETFKTRFIKKPKDIQAVLLKQCIEHHQAILKFCERIEGVFRTCILMQMIVCAVAVSIAALQITQVRSINEIVKYIQCICFLLGSLFIYCWYGEKITTESISVGDCLYNTEWYRASISVQKNILFMIIRTQKPVYLTAAGFVNATLFAYTQVLKASMSYFTLLRSLTED